MEKDCHPKEINGKKGSMGLKGTWHNLALDNHNRYNCYQATNTLKGVVLPWKMQHTKAPWPVEHCIRMNSK